MTADVIYHIDDLDELTECALLSSAFYLAVIRLIVYTLHRKDMLYVVEIMREDWVKSSYEDRIVLKEKCIFAFRLAKYFINMVTGTIVVFACVPILEVRARYDTSSSHLFLRRLLFRNCDIFF